MSSGTPQRDELVAALIVAKCVRWTMGTCPSRDVVGGEWCAVCDVLSRLGYEPTEQLGTSAETWRRIGR